MKYISRSVVAAVAVVGLAGCASGEAASDDENGLTEVSIGGVVSTSTVPIYIAQSEGIFEEHGLDVTMEPTQNFSAAAPSLLNGQLDFATAAVPPFIMAIDQGMPLKAVAGTSASVEDPSQEGNQLVVAEDSPVESIEDVSGMTIGTNAIGAGPYVGFLATYLDAGGELSDIEWSAMPMNEQIEALESGNLDAAVLAEPFTTMATSSGNRVVASLYREPGHEILEPGDAYVVLLSSEEFLAENSDVAEAMRAALIEANEVAAENPEMVRDLLVSEADVTPEIAEELLLPGFTGELTGDELDRLGQAMEKADLLDEPFDGHAATWLP